MNNKPFEIFPYVEADDFIGLKRYKINDQLNRIGKRVVLCNTYIGWHEKTLSCNGIYKEALLIGERDYVPPEPEIGCPHTVYTGGVFIRMAQAGYNFCSVCGEELK